MKITLCIKNQPDLFEMDNVSLGDATRDDFICTVGNAPEAYFIQCDNGQQTLCVRKSEIQFIILEDDIDSESPDA